MPFELPFSVKILDQEHIDDKYLKTTNTPYASVAEANAIIIPGIRPQYLTVNIAGVDYWWKDGVADIDLVVKSGAGSGGAAYSFENGLSDDGLGVVSWGGSDITSDVNINGENGIYLGGIFNGNNFNNANRQFVSRTTSGTVLAVGGGLSEVAYLKMEDTGNVDLYADQSFNLYADTDATIEGYTALNLNSFGGDATINAMRLAVNIADDGLGNGLFHNEGLGGSFLTESGIEFNTFNGSLSMTLPSFQMSGLSGRLGIADLFIQNSIVAGIDFGTDAVDATFVNIKSPNALQFNGVAGSGGQFLSATGWATPSAGVTPDSTELVKGILKLSTQVLADAGSDDLTALTPLKASRRSRKISTQNISGAVSIDLSTAEMFILTLTGNVTSFTFTNEELGKDYIFVFKQGTTAYTLAWTAGKYRFPFANAPVLTDPTTNGTTPASSSDIITAICTVAGRLSIAYTPDLIDN